ncbi:MAG: HEPN domain-containing protein [Desulfomonile sp.]|nr:HEPN domain-containing protein [Desulfomonile sp.]
MFGFHAQQTVEKALKSWLSLRGIAYPKTHGLSVLLRLLDTHAEDIPDQFLGLLDLTDFTILFRHDFRACTKSSIAPVFSPMSSLSWST